MINAAMTFFGIVFTLICLGLNIDGEEQECILRKYDFDSYVCVCNETVCDTTAPVDHLKHGEYVIITSSSDGDRFRQVRGSFSETKDTPGKIEPNIVIDRKTKFQTIEGFGAGFSDAGGINILSLPDKAQDYLLKSYFTPEGLDFNLGRVPIGCADVSTHFYTYDDWEDDGDLTHFSLAEEDYKYKIPIIKQAQHLTDHKIKLIASAWTAPQWMKQDNVEQGGHLKRKYYQTWADYHVRFLDSYKEEGIKFWAITTGNEPINGLYPARINSMSWSPINQRRWIINNLGPAIKNSIHRKTKIIIFDERREALNVWAHVIAGNDTARSYISGIGLHIYSDIYTSLRVLDVINKDFPDLFLLYTEACAGVRQNPRVALGSWTRGEEYVLNIIENLSHWVTGWMEWNLALDMQGNPNYVNNSIDAMIIVNSKAKEFYKQPLFYAIGHFSKYIPRDSVRIAADINHQFCLRDPVPAVSCVLEIKYVAFKRPDGGIAVVLLNRKDEDVHLTITDPKRGSAKITLKRRSFNTFLYW